MLLNVEGYGPGLILSQVFINTTFFTKFWMLVYEIA